MRDEFEYGRADVLARGLMALLLAEGTIAFFVSSPTGPESIMCQMLDKTVDDKLVILAARQQRACRACINAGTALECTHLDRILSIEHKSKYREQQILALMEFDMAAQQAEARGLTVDPANAWFSRAFIDRLDSLPYIQLSASVTTHVILIGVDPNINATTSKSSECGMCAIAFTVAHGFVVSTDWPEVEDRRVQGSDDVLSQGYRVLRRAKSRRQSVTPRTNEV